MIKERDMLDKLIPMSMDEMSINLNEKLKEMTQNILDSSSIFQSPSKTHFEDFSANSFEIIENVEEDTITKEVESKMKKKIDRSSELENMFNIKYDKNKENITNIEDIPHSDLSSIYMKSILDFFKSLNFKIDNLSYQKSADKFVLEEVQSHLMLNNSKKALGIIN